MPTQNIEISGWGLIDIFNRDNGNIGKNILQHLSIYEKVGLCRLNKTWKNLITTSLEYEPYELQVNSLKRLNNIAPYRRKYELDVLAHKAYENILANLRNRVSKDINYAVYADIALIGLDHNFYMSNCIATLSIGNVKIYAVNFSIENKTLYEAIDKNMQKHGYIPLYQTYRSHHQELAGKIVPMADWWSPSGQSSYHCKKHHAEMRLVARLDDPYTTQITGFEADKVCCVFCAVQLAAMGRTDLVNLNGGWRAGKLHWYDFSPLVMFFQNRRKEMWGPETDAAFQSLLNEEKLYFLDRLVGCTQNKCLPDPCKDCGTEQPLGWDKGVFNVFCARCQSAHNEPAGFLESDMGNMESDPNATDSPNRAKSRKLSDCPGCGQPLSGGTSHDNQLCAVCSSGFSG